MERVKAIRKQLLLDFRRLRLVAQPCYQIPRISSEALYRRQRQLSHSECVLLSVSMIYICAGARPSKSGPKTLTKCSVTLPWPPQTVENGFKNTIKVSIMIEMEREDSR